LLGLFFLSFKPDSFKFLFLFLLNLPNSFFSSAFFILLFFFFVSFLCCNSIFFGFFCFFDCCFLCLRYFFLLFTIPSKQFWVIKSTFLCLSELFLSGFLHFFHHFLFLFFKTIISNSEHFLLQWDRLATQLSLKSFYFVFEGCCLRMAAHINILKKVSHPFYSISVAFYILACGNHFDRGRKLEMLCLFGLWKFCICLSYL
jgi:hypothetical protein